MRSLILISATLGLLIAAFALYALLQPAVPADVAAGTQLELPQPPQPPAERSGIIGTGEGVWVNNYDEQDRLVSRFRAAKYDPKSDETVHVIAPQAEFFLQGGQVLRIEGEEGDVMVAHLPPRSRGVFAFEQTEPPRRGELRNVRILLFESADALESPSLIVEVSSAVFDNDTFRIYTEAHQDAGGEWIERDQVPVHVRSEDFDFEGRGLVIHWNEPAQRLEYVEITHGDRLEVRNVEVLSRLGGADVPAQGGDQAPATSLVVNQSVAGADAAPQALSSAQAGLPAPALYRATFHDDVRIMQAEQQFVQGDVMHVDFPLKQGKIAAGGGAPPPNRMREAVAPDHDVPEHDPPVLVYWSGKLTLAPHPQPKMPEEEAVVQLIGSPLVLRQGEGQVVAQSLRFSTADSAFRLDGSPQHPLVIDDGSGTRIATTTVLYSPVNRSATLTGASSAEIRITADGAADEMMHVQWAEQCLLRFAEASGQNLVIERAELSGEVRIEHPQISLDSGGLELHFEQASEASSERRLGHLIATEDAVCVLDDDGNEVILEGQRLEVEMAYAEANAAYPRLLRIEGDAAVMDELHELAAGEIDISFVPGEPGDLELERLVARGEVRFSSADFEADGDLLEIDGHGSDVRLRLTGSEAAHIADRDFLLGGREIVFVPAGEQARVAGAGFVRSNTRGIDDKVSATVSWSRGATLDGRGNRIDVEGDVKGVQHESDGTVNLTKGRRARVDLVEVAEAAPASSVRGSREGRRGFAGEEVNFLKDKTIAAITFEEDAEASSTLLAEDGSLLRRTNLLAETIRYEVAGQRLLVPAPGRLLHEDHRPEATADDAAAPDRGPANMRGTTAFQWQQNMIFDRSEGVAKMSGDVVVAHRGLGDAPFSFRLEAPVVLAEIDAEEDAAHDLTAGTDRIDVKRLVAEDGVRFSSGAFRFNAAAMEYSPETQVLIARGSERHPAELYDEQGVSRGTFEELRYNTRTEELRITAPGAQVRPVRD